MCLCEWIIRPSLEELEEMFDFNVLALMLRHLSSFQLVLEFSTQVLVCVLLTYFVVLHGSCSLALHWVLYKVPPKELCQGNSGRCYLKNDESASKAC